MTMPKKYYDKEKPYIPNKYLDFGYVIMPELNKGLFSTRDEYIDYCLKTGTVSIINADRDIVDNVLVLGFDVSSEEGERRFPKIPATASEFGSPVVIAYVQNKSYNAVILGSYTEWSQKDFVFNENQSYRRRKGADYNVVDQFDDGKGNREIHVISNGSNPGRIVLNVINHQDAGELEIRCRGTTLYRASKKKIIESDQEIEIRAITSNTTKHGGSSPELYNKIVIKRGTGIELHDEWGNIISTTQDRVNIKSSKEIYVGDGADQKLVLGNKLKTVFDGLYNALKNWVPAPTDGGLALKTALTAWLTTTYPSTDYLSQNNKVK